MKGKKKKTEKYVLRLKFKNGRQITKKEECSELYIYMCVCVCVCVYVYIYIYMCVYKQFINTLNFTGFLLKKRVTKHTSLI